MRIMLFTDTFPPHLNGVATSVYNLARALAEEDHQVLVCTVSSKRSTDASFSVLHVRALPLIRSFGLGLAPPIYPVVLRSLARFRPHVLHSHTPFGMGWQAVLASRIGSIPLLGTNHSHPDVFSRNVGSYKRFDGILDAIARHLTSVYYNRCDLVSSASDFLSRDMSASGVRRRIVITPNVVDTTLFSPLRSTGFASGRSATKRIVYFGRLSPDKNLDQLILMVTPVLKEFSPNISLDIVGDGPEREHLTNLVNAHGLGRQVRFIGRLDGIDLARTIARSDICVTASRTENQSMSLLESLACGVPVVALRAGGIPEIIRDGYNGFTVEDGADATRQFAERLRCVLSDSSLHQSMRANALAFSQRHNQTCLRATMDSYLETIRAASARIGHQAAPADPDSTARPR